VDGVKTMRKGKNTQSNVEIMAATVLLDNPRLSAPKLKAETERRLRKKGEVFDELTVRTYYTYKTNIKSNTKSDNPLDEQWSIAACEKYNIPDDMIPILIENVKLFSVIIDYMGTGEKGDPHDDDGWIEMECPRVTIRIAKRMSRLKTSVDVLIEKYKNQDIKPPGTAKERESFIRWLLYNIAYRYSFLEQLSESLGYEHFNSSEADELFFMKEYRNYLEFKDLLEVDDFTMDMKSSNEIDETY